MTQVLVTRPVQDAAAWMHAIEEAGWEAIEFPLLDVSPTLHLEGRQAVYQQILKSQAVMFVSANAVRFLAMAFKEQAHWVNHFKHHARAWCTGPGTAAALIKCGIPESQIDQPFADAKQLDSEALWAVVQNQVSVNMTALFIRGADESGAIAGRDWLATQLENRGAQVQARAVYQRLPSQLSDAQKELVKQYVTQGAIWLFSSSACLHSLVDQCPDLDWSKAKAVVTHPRIAVLAQQLGWASPSIANPGIDSLLGSIKSLA